MKNFKTRLMSVLLSMSFVVSSVAITADKANAATNNYSDSINCESHIQINYADAATNRSKVVEFVTRMYSVCLDRTPDTTGLNSWVDQLLSRQATGCSVAFGFVYSQEFQNKNCSNAEYITYMYNAFFGRTPDAAGLADWVSQLDSGVSREHIFYGFANSAEFAALCDSYGVIRGDYVEGGDWQQTAMVNLFVDRLYSNVLNRSCDTAGMTDWTMKLLTGRATGAGVAYGFVFSQEMIARNLCDSCFLDVLYMSFMGRPADEGGKSNWLSLLASGASREDVFNGFVGSQEFTGICNTYGINRGNPDAVGNTHMGPGECGNRHSTPTPTPVAIPTQNPGLINGYTQLAVPTNVTNTGSRLTIASFNDEFQLRVDEFSNVSYNQYINLDDTTLYVEYLDTVLASGDNAPDLIVCDSTFGKNYANSSNTMPINSLGISYSELSNMYNYTLQYATDNDNVIKALTWQACPCGVFYNVNVAQATLGVSSPEEVAPYFASWDAFLNTSRQVASTNYRCVSNYDEVLSCFLNTRSAGWVVNNAFNYDPVLNGYFDLAKVLYDENLTWGDNIWSSRWYGNVNNERVLSFWGPMWMGAVFDMTSGNTTAGDWRMVPSPEPYFWGGSWIMATKYCDRKADVAQIMRDITINPTNLRAINSEYSDFVNNYNVMNTVALSSAGNVEWLGGQNPFGMLLTTAVNIDNNNVGRYDSQIQGYFGNVVERYVQGDITTVTEARNILRQEIIEAGFASR